MAPLQLGPTLKGPSPFKALCEAGKSLRQDFLTDSYSLLPLPTHSSSLPFSLLVMIPEMFPHKPPADYSPSQSLLPVQTETVFVTHSSNYLHFLVPCHALLGYGLFKAVYFHISWRIAWIHNG